MQVKSSRQLLLSIPYRLLLIAFVVVVAVTVAVVVVVVVNERMRLSVCVSVVCLSNCLSVRLSVCLALSPIPWLGISSPRIECLLFTPNLPEPHQSHPSRTS